MTSLEGRVAVVTGASRGIGLASAQALHERGATVVLTARTAEAAEKAAAEVGERAVGIGAHVTDEGAAAACFEQIVASFGRVDILVNNAGTNPAYGPVLDQDRGRFFKTLEVNLWGPVLWSRLAVEAGLGRSGPGSIVNMASIGGLENGPMLGTYHVSKAALIHLTKQLSLELAPAVRVNALAPGVVRTRLAEALWSEQEERVAAETPLGRIGEPSDVGSAVAFLAGDESSWITGATLVIDGGQLIGPAFAASERTP